MKYILATLAFAAMGTVAFAAPLNEVVFDYQADLKTGEVKVMKFTDSSTYATCYVSVSNGVASSTNSSISCVK